MDPNQEAAIRALIESRVGIQNLLALKVYANLLIRMGVGECRVYALNLTPDQA